MALSFVNVSDDVKTSANARHSLTGKRSPFRDGLEFTITGFDYRHPEEDGKVNKTRIAPVLITSLGDLFVSRLTNRYATHDFKSVQCGGDLVDLYNKTLDANSTKTDGEILTAFVKAVKGKKVVVTLREYINKFGNPADVADFNFKA